MAQPTPGSYHQPVLWHEALDALAVQPDGIYVDATLGGGGHAAGILERLGPAGRLIAFDQDEDAWKNLPGDPRATLAGENFRHLRRFLRLYGALPVNGILADLGVSSHQFDTPERGFSTRGDALLDMRMDKRQSLTAAAVLREYSRDELQRLFERYGEVSNARTLADRIDEARKSFPMKTVGELKAVSETVSRGNPRRYLAQVFQALRIAVNDEFGALEEMMDQAAEVLAPAGRLVIITFHSLEDRLVKDFMKSDPRLRPVYKKPVEPDPGEVSRNPRARSARLRAAGKISAAEAEA
jgi:16S rRNA (cytosine1402-N4)-methyltransferase